MTLDLHSPDVVPTRAVDRALALLSEVCGPEPIGLAEAARRTTLPASTALRLLRTLEAAGFVRRDADGAFSAGPRLLQLGATALSRSSLAHLGEPALRRIVGLTGESTYLSVRGPGDQAIHIAMAEGTRSVRHTSWVGRSVPLAGLAVGRALTGDVPRAGFVTQRDAFEQDVTAVAAPVRGPGGITAALSLVGPTHRLDDHCVERFGRIVADEAARLSSALGAGPTMEQETGA